MKTEPRAFVKPDQLADETTAMRYVIYILSCARSPLLGPLAEHLMRSIEPAPEADAPDAAGAPPSAGAPLRATFATYAATIGAFVPEYAWSAPSGSDDYPAGLPRKAREFDRRFELQNLIANAQAHRVVFTWDDGNRAASGAVMRAARPRAVRQDLRRPPQGFVGDALRATAIGPVVVYMNPTLPRDEVFNVLLHELAHLLLGHVGSDPLKARETVTPTTEPGFIHRPVGELEAESAAIIAGSRRCARRREGFGYVRRHFDLVRHDELMPIVGFVRVFLVAEILIAWCRTRPDRDAVIDLPRVGPPPRRVVRKRGVLVGEP